MKTETDNRGKSLPVWCCDEYELCENVNMGVDGGWMFELTLRGVRIAVRPSLKEGKQAALEHQHNVTGEASRSRLSVEFVFEAAS